MFERCWAISDGSRGGSDTERRVEFESAVEVEGGNGRKSKLKGTDSGCKINQACSPLLTSFSGLQAFPADNIQSCSQKLCLELDNYKVMAQMQNTKKQSRKHVVMCTHMHTTLLVSRWFCFDSFLSVCLSR